MNDNELLAKLDASNGPISRAAADRIRALMQRRSDLQANNDDLLNRARDAEGVLNAFRIVAHFIKTGDVLKVS